jgi:hypothetical protein
MPQIRRKRDVPNNANRAFDRETGAMGVLSTKSVGVADLPSEQLSISQSCAPPGVQKFARA